MNKWVTSQVSWIGDTLQGMGGGGLLFWWFEWDDWLIPGITIYDTIFVTTFG